MAMALEEWRCSYGYKGVGPGRRMAMAHGYELLMNNLLWLLLWLL